jgi:hypothetical protein
MTYDEAFCAVSATLLECHRQGMAGESGGPTVAACWDDLQTHLTQLCALLLAGGRIPEATIAHVAFSAMSTLAASDVRRASEEQAVSGEVARLCDLAGGQPRG